MSNSTKALALGGVMVIFYPIAFSILINYPSEIVSLSIGLFYAVAGFTSIYYSNN